MTGYRRGPLCGESNPNFLRTPGVTGVNDAGDPTKPMLVADRRAPVVHRRKFTFGPVSRPYTGPPYILGKPEIAHRLIREFVAVARKTYKSRFEILQALIALANRELQKLHTPLPDVPRTPPKSPIEAGGFSCACEQEAASHGVWEIKLFPASMDLNPQRKPEEFADQCGTIAHEWEHLIDTFYGVRFAVARGGKNKSVSKDLNVPLRIVVAARSRPLKWNTTEYLQAEEFYWFGYFTQLAKKKSDPTKELDELSSLYIGAHDKLKQLKRYNTADRSILDIDYRKILTKAERAVEIKKVEAELRTLKRKIVAARRRYVALPKETVGHIVQEIYKKGVLQALAKSPVS